MSAPQLATVIAVVLYICVSWNDYLYGDEFKARVISAVVEGGA